MLVARTCTYFLLMRHNILSRTSVGVERGSRRLWVELVGTLPRLHLAMFLYSPNQVYSSCPNNLSDIQYPNRNREQLVQC